VEWPASREDGDYADEKGSNDKSESNIDGIAIPLTKTICKSKVECQHGQLERPHQHRICSPPSDLNFRANYRRSVFWIIGGQCCPLSVGQAIISEAMRDMTHAVRKRCLCRVEYLLRIGISK
jgi:hypothetical protein